jgi:tagatose 6-phosphate kinase
VSFVGVETAAETRTCSTLLDLASGAVTELVEEGGALSAAEWAALEAQVRSRLPGAQIMLLAGKLPPDSPADAYARLMRLAHEAGVPALLDSQGEAVKAATPMRPLLVKMNAVELAATVGRHLSADADLVAGARELNAAGAEWVALTRGASPAWLVGPREQWEFRLPSLAPVNPIGCGDAMLAGTAAALARRNPMPEAVRYGLACGCAKALEMSNWGFDAERAARFAAEIVAVSR